MAFVSGGRKSFEVDGGLAKKAADETRRIFVHFRETDLCRPVVDQVEVRLVGPSWSKVGLKLKPSRCQPGDYDA